MYVQKGPTIRIWAENREHEQISTTLLFLDTRGMVRRVSIRKSYVSESQVSSEPLVDLPD